MKRKLDGMQASVNQRVAFNRQPARLLVIDVQSGLDPQTSANLCEAMANVFSLATSLAGPNRIPFLGLMLLHNHPEVIYPLQPLRGNFGRLVSALNDLRHNRKSCDLPPEDATKALGDSVKEGLTMFRRQAQGLLQTAGHWAQLELTFFTCRDVSKISKSLNTLTKDLDLDGLKKIQVVCMSGEDLLGVSEPILPTIQSQSSDGSDASNMEHDMGIVDTTTIDNSVLCLENYLLSWLHDSGTDTEHLHLTFPQPTSEGEELNVDEMTGEDGASLTLKCDVQERILNPSNLPFTSSFYMGMEGVSGKGQPSGRGAVTSLPISKLRIINRLPADGVCESVVYGTPYIVRATSCWKIDWEDLETNQQHFLALCQTLANKNEVLLAELDTEPATNQSNFRYNSPARPSGSFILLPSQKGSLLLKSITSRELLMPLGLTGLDQVSDTSLALVQNALEQVEPLESYNPLLTSSSLHKCLIAQLTKSLPRPPPRHNMAPNMAAIAANTKVFPQKPTTAKPLIKKSQQERKPLLAGPAPGAPHSSFTSARWALEQTQDSRASSGRQFYSNRADDIEDFPTQL